MPLETVTGHLALPTALRAITSKADRLARTDGGACQKLAPVYWTPPHRLVVRRGVPTHIKYSTTPTSMITPHPSMSPSLENRRSFPEFSVK